MDAPILGSATELFGLGDEDDGWVGLFEEEEIQEEGDETHDGSEPRSPSPAEVTFHDEATDERREERSAEDGHREDCDGQSTSSVVKHVGEHGGNDSEWASSEDSFVRC